MVHQAPRLHQHATAGSEAAILLRDVLDDASNNSKASCLAPRQLLACRAQDGAAAPAVPLAAVGGPGVVCSLLRPSRRYRMLSQSLQGLLSA